MKRTLRIAAAGLIPLTLGLAWPRAGAAPGARAWTQKSFLDFGAGRLEDGGANSYVAADGSKNVAITADVSDPATLQGMLASPPPEVLAAMQEHGVVQPITAYVER